MDNDELRLKILRLIESNPSMSQRQIANELGISLGGVNYCLKALAEIGWIKVGNFAKSDHKLGYLYLLTPGVSKKKQKSPQAFWRKNAMNMKLCVRRLLRLEVELADEPQTANSVKIRLFIFLRWLLQERHRNLYT